MPDEGSGCHQGRKWTTFIVNYTVIATGVVSDSSVNSGFSLSFGFRLEADGYVKHKFAFSIIGALMTLPSPVISLVTCVLFSHQGLYLL